MLIQAVHYIRTHTLPMQRYMGCAHLSQLFCVFDAGYLQLNAGNVSTIEGTSCFDY